MASLGPSRGRGRRRRLVSEINVTPFVDVTLVLLIIFMVAAPLLTVGVPVDLPKTEAKSLPNEQEPISITVLQNGKIFLQSEEISFDGVLPKIQEIAGENLERRIYLRGDNTANYGVIMQVMARINAAGYKNIGLVTDPISQ